MIMAVGIVAVAVIGLAGRAVARRQADPTSEPAEDEAGGAPDGPRHYDVAAGGGRDAGGDGGG